MTLGLTTTVIATFSYDALGNILTKSDVGVYSYAGSGYANPHGATTIASSSLSYDDNGNVTAYDGMSLAWTYRNELASTTIGTSTVSYGYDHTGSRVFKQGSVTTKYPSRLYELASSTPTKHVYAGEMLVATISGTGTSTASTTYAHADHLGSTRVTTDADGQTVQELNYTSFGEVTEDTLSGSGEHRQYIGEAYDPESELSYLNARYYQGSRGQFLSQDPVSRIMNTSDERTQQILRNPQLANMYSYAGNNPMMFKDPEGEFGIAALFGIGMAVNMFGQYVETSLAQGTHRWEDYAGAAAGGAAGTYAGLRTKNAYVVGGVASGVEEGATQILKSASSGTNQMNITDVAVQSAAGATFAKHGLPQLAGVTVGRNSNLAITSQITTKLANGTIANFSGTTGAKIGSSQMASMAPQAIFNGVASNSQTLQMLNSIVDTLTKVRNYYQSKTK